MQGWFLSESVCLQPGNEAGRNFADVLKDQKSSQLTSLQAASYIEYTHSQMHQDQTPSTCAQSMFTLSHHVHLDRGSYWDGWA